MKNVTNNNDGDLESPLHDDPQNSSKDKPPPVGWLHSEIDPTIAGSKKRLSNLHVMKKELGSLEFPLLD